MKQDGKATNQYKGYPIVQTDKSNGVVMDAERPVSPTYNTKQIGPQSKTGFGKNRQA